MKLRWWGVVAFSLMAGHAQAVKFNQGGLGCGTIISMRESTQKPISSELKDEYNSPRSSGGVFLQILSGIPGVGLTTAVAGEVVANTVISNTSARMQAADQVRQEAEEKYDDVQAIEFRFDDGLVINVPVYVVSGMRYKVGARLNAMISPRYGTPALGANVLFAGMPDPGDGDYEPACRIDGPQARKAALAPLQHMVDEQRIVDPKERRSSPPATASNGENVTTK